MIVAIVAKRVLRRKTGGGLSYSLVRLCEASGNVSSRWPTQIEDPLRYVFPYSSGFVLYPLKLFASQFTVFY